MKYNKGFAPILIALIVAGALVIGGGAYYLGKSSSNVEKAIEVNNQVENLTSNQNQPVIEVKKENSTVVENKKTNTSLITVLTPNGGEVYKYTDKISIKWNGISKDRVAIYLRFSTGEWCSVADLSSSNTSYTFTPFGHNCGDGRGVISGVQKYKITLIAYENGGMAPEPGTAFATSYSDGDDISYSIDSSDNYFTINASSISQSQAETLVYQTWSDCSKGDCGGVSVTVSKNLVTAIYNELSDSTSNTKRESLATYKDGKWTLGKPTITQTCHRGHSDGSQGYSSSPCI